MAVDVVTALYALQRPTAGLEHLAKLLSGNRLHNSISVTWASTPATALSVATSIQPCAASLMFDNVSGRSSPSDTHPGKPGTSAQKPPSSAGCTRTLSFMMHSIYRGFWWFKGARAYSLAQPLLIKAHRPDNPIFPAFGQAGNGKPVIERSPGGRDPAPGGRSRGPAQGPADALRRHRADALGGALAFEDYLELVDWTGRALRADKRGHIEGGDAEPPGSSTIVGAKRGSCVLRRTQDPIFQLALSIASIRYPLRSTQPLSIGSTGFPVSDHDYRVREQSRYFRY